MLKFKLKLELGVIGQVEVWGWTCKYTPQNEGSTLKTKLHILGTSRVSNYFPLVHRTLKLELEP